MSRTIIAKLSFGLIAAAIASSAFAVQDRNNPLHPSYFVGKTAVATVSGSGERYVDAGNPLHPAYGRGGSQAWQATGTASAQAFIDKRNPLHPRFVR